MTEADWPTVADPRPMLEFLQGASERKLRLFACGCCRRVQSSLFYDENRRLVEIAERFADGTATRGDMDQAFGVATLAWMGLKWYGPGDRAITASYAAMSLWPESRPVDTVENTLQVAGAEAAHAALHLSSRERSYWLWKREGQLSGQQVREAFARGHDSEQSAQVELVRCVFGNPFRPVAADPQWLTSTVVALAEGVYQDRAWDRLPILADALMDAGCDCEGLLGHCRNGGPHCRGCWVVDLLTGRT